MNDFTFEEQNLVCIYNSSGTRAGVIVALTEMRAIWSRTRTSCGR